MEKNIFIFLAGLHKSGTSLLHEVLRDHPSISGFSNTGVPEDEGQHLQSIIEPAYVYGGPGKFVFDKRAYMDESHPLATPEYANLIFSQWQPYFDLSCKYLIEKSPPTIIRTRFFQKLYPTSKFLVIFRHPLVVAYATKKWRKTSSILELIDHTLRAYEIFLEDLKLLNSCYVLRYEDFIHEPQQMVQNIYTFLGIKTVLVRQEVRKNVNDKYFSKWDSDQRNLFSRLMRRVPKEIPVEFEVRANRCGYSFKERRSKVLVPWLGINSK